MLLLLISLIVREEKEEKEIIIIIIIIIIKKSLTIFPSLQDFQILWECPLQKNWYQGPYYEKKKIKNKR